MSSAPQNKLEGDGEPAWFALHDYVARLKNHMAHQRERSINDLLNHFAVNDKGAVRVAHRNDFQHDAELNTGRKQP